MVLASRPSPSSGLDISIYSDVIDFLAAPDGQLFVVPFAKSATTGQHTPVSVSRRVVNCVTELP